MWEWLIGIFAEIMEKAMKLFIRLEEYRKAVFEREKTEIELNKLKEEERIKIRAEGAFPYVMGWINEQQQGLIGQKELSFSYLRDFLPDEDRRVLEICWGRIKTLDGVSYDRDRNIYILSRW